LIQHDVDEGHDAVNFSEWNHPQRKAGDAAKEVREADMPPRSYLFMHPLARLSSAERAQLASGLDRTIGASPRHRERD